MKYERNMKINLWVLLMTCYVPSNSVGFHIMIKIHKPGPPEKQTSRCTLTHVHKRCPRMCGMVSLRPCCLSTDTEENHASTCLSETHMRSCHTGLRSTEMPRLTMLQLITATLNLRDNGNPWDK